MAIQLVVFDAYGTLFDVYSIGALAEKLYERVRQQYAKEGHAVDEAFPSRGFQSPGAAAA